MNWTTEQQQLIEPQPKGDHTLQGQGVRPSPGLNPGAPGKGATSPIRTALDAPPLGGDGGLVSVLSFGDMSTLSFHATKVYSTVIYEDRKNE